MTVTTSTTASISVNVTSDSSVDSVPVVVQEDVYKGTTLLGTTYRNVKLSSSYLNPDAPTAYVNRSTVGRVPCFAGNRTINAFSGDGPDGVATGEIGCFDVNTGNYHFRLLSGSTDPYLIFPWWESTVNTGSRSTVLWGGTQPTPNYFFYTSNDVSGETLHGQHVNWPQWFCDWTTGQSGELPSGLNHIKIRFDRGLYSTAGEFEVSDVTTQLPANWKFVSVTGRDAYTSSTSDWTVSNWCSLSSPHQNDIWWASGAGDSSHVDATVTCTVDMRSAADTNLYITWRGVLHFVKPDATETQPYEGYSPGGTLQTQMLLDPSYYSIVNGIVTIKIKRGQISTTATDQLALVAFDYLSKI